MPFFGIVHISMLRDKKYHILTLSDKKYRNLMFRDKTELYLTVLQQNNVDESLRCEASLSVWLTLVDRPTQLIYIWIFICWVGGGNPCGAAEFCFIGLYCHKKQARSNFFSKYPCYVHKDCLEAKKLDDKMSKTFKKLVYFMPLSHQAWYS